MARDQNGSGIDNGSRPMMFAGGWAQKQLFARGLLSRIALAALVGQFAVASASAQETGATAAAQKTRGADATIEELTVTGTRLSTGSFESPTPVSVVSTAELEQRGVANFAVYLSELPEFVNSNNPQTTTLWSLKNGSTYNDLRGLGPNRTLTLLDGQRFAPTAPDGTLDMNVFPTALIERIDVVTGGASAAYGSDAVAGVVNVITNKHFTGVKGDLQYGQSQYSDAKTTTGSFAAGAPLLDGRAHLVASLDFERDGGVRRQTDRPWGVAAPCIMHNPAYNGPNSQGISQRIIGYNCTLSQATLGGVITSPGALSGYQFGPGSTLEPFVPGANYSPSSPFMSGGSGASMGQDRYISVPYDRHTAYASFRYSLTDTIEAFADASVAQSHGDNATAQNWDFGSITINSDNPYIPAALRPLLAQNGTSSFQLGRVNTDMGFYVADSKSNTTRYVIGVEGKNAEWTWNAYAQQGETNYLNLQINNRIQQNFLYAVDAVTDPATGQIVCRATLTGGAPGCVPMNVLGNGSPSAAAMAYTHGTEEIAWSIQQQVAAASASKSIPTLPAGPLAIAFGGEYRKESANGNVDPLAASGGYTVVSPVPPVIGTYHVTEEFVEFGQPILKDLPLASLLSIDVAGRSAKYSTAGTAKAWKIGVSYFPVSDLQLRGLISADVRAPNLSELYSKGGLRFDTIYDPTNNKSYAIDITGGGNPSLQVETAKTKSAGFVYKPRWAQGVALSMDWFDIRLTNGIGGLSAQDQINFCQNGDQQACAAIRRGPNGLITTISNTLFNVAGERHEGIDIQGQYTRELQHSMFGLPTHLTLNLASTNTQHWTQTPDGKNFSELAGQVGANVGGSGVPKWRGNLTADLAIGPGAVNARIRYVGGGKYLNTWTTADFAENDLGAVEYLDLSARYRFNAEGQYPYELYGGVDNTLNKAPPVNPENFFIVGYTNYQLYDTIGRRFYLGIRARF
ncbi:MAG TPA: TonB-dependent receptor [Steroidobacteraceae bacterium]|jgi:outer membrane receptor protein involved in Fe transport|nr:TonB-dependent receptor [Steroidobacteraceae bacterium]